MEKEQNCPCCNGEGWIQDHSRDCDPYTGMCSHECPVQEACHRCNGTGNYDVFEENEKERRKEYEDSDLPF